VHRNSSSALCLRPSARDLRLVRQKPTGEPLGIETRLQNRFFHVQ